MNLLSEGQRQQTGSVPGLTAHLERELETRQVGSWYRTANLTTLEVIPEREMAVYILDRSEFESHPGRWQDLRNTSVIGVYRRGQDSSRESEYVGRTEDSADYSNKFGSIVGVDAGERAIRVRAAYPAPETEFTFSPDDFV